MANYQNLFLPTNREEMNERGWHYLDFLLISGDAYVDHPSFGPAIISRILENAGFKVGIIAQPDWRNIDDFVGMGRPKYACLLTSGNIDSMVNNLTANKKRRRVDAYSPGGQAGLRPDRAIIVYSNKIREAFPDIPLIIGGIEASLRRFVHYDYWDDKLRRSILQDTKADILVYGMGEKQILEIASRLAKGEKIEQLMDIAGTVYRAKDLQHLNEYIKIPGFEEAQADKKKYLESFRIEFEEQDPIRGNILVQPHGDWYIIQNQPAMPLTTKEMDMVYDLPYNRYYLSGYEALGGVPAIKEVEFSITSHRGCFGGCAFCALHFHQGRIIQSRSHESILKEAQGFLTNPRFKGIIHDVGGPTANFRQPSCQGQLKRGTCKNRQCLFPEPCPKLEIDHKDYLQLLRKLRNIPGVKKVFVRSGLRYDYLMADKSDEFFRELCQYHISGQLKVAPEHVVEAVTKKMQKPNRQVFDSFVAKYNKINQKIGKKQFLVPYFMSSHPGSGLKEAVHLAEYIRDMGYNPEQVQDFTPTPGTISTCSYYTGMDPFSGERVFVAKSAREKQMQRALMQYRLPANYEIVKAALHKAGRNDLIGYGPKALIRSSEQKHEDKTVNNKPAKRIKTRKKSLKKQ